jgi:hypothetical protein
MFSRNCHWGAAATKSVKSENTNTDPARATAPRGGAVPVAHGGQPARETRQPPTGAARGLDLDLTHSRELW